MTHPAALQRSRRQPGRCLTPHGPAPSTLHALPRLTPARRSASRARGLLVSLLLSASLGAGVAAAEPEALLAEQEHAAALPDGGPWWEREAASSDWLGRRTALEAAGVESFARYAAEAWGNTTGGLRRGAVYTGLLDWGASLDLERLAGWKGASATTTWLWLTGEDASEELVGNLFTVSNLAGLSSVRLLEAWLEQRLLEDTLSLRIGHLTADAEFAVAESSLLFLNATFGWPAFLSSNLPEATPAYPMGALGARITLQPSDGLAFQSAAFYGDPFAQNADEAGFCWGLDADVGWLWISEAQLGWGQVGGAPPGRAKGGFWLHSASSPADDADAGSMFSGGHGFYLVLEQTLAPEAGEASAAAPAANDPSVPLADEAAVEADAQGLAWFARVAFSPSAGSALGFYVDTGLTYTGLLPTREQDTLGIGIAYGQLTSGERQALADDGVVPADGELVIEATYRCQLTPWLALQPDLQVVLDPGGRRDLDPAVVTGMRASIRF